ncbi:hypothetical protein [Acinetobacter sp. YH12040]|uniref:hypothetical protein n=1 Tax=Acinetobacter sp. YH12040 TaxID=2601048 RepID=UPI0015D161FE|nr:hypothetical protein [Acinetobacter sp. YH12040]
MMLNKKTIISLLLSVTLLCFAKPFFTWFNAYVIVVPVLVLLLFAIFNNFLIIRKLDLNFIILFVLLALIFIPFREFDIFSLYNLVLVFLVFLVFLMDGEVVYKAANNFINIMAAISIFTIISYVFLTFNIPFPHIYINNEARTDRAFIYFSAVFLDSQAFNVGGLNIYRANGWFQEPGHFGIYLAMALILMEKTFTSFKGKIITIALFLTFSSSAYILYFLILFLKNLKSTKIVIPIILIFISCLSYLYIPFITSLMDNLFFYKFQTDSVLEDRSRGGDYLGEISLSNYFWGKGFEFLSLNDILISDYRRFIVSSGFISLFFLFIFFMLICFNAIKNKNTILLCTLLTVFVIFLHRSWMLYQGFVWIYLTMIMVLSKYLKAK